MAWVRQLDSGLWAATVRTPAGRRTKTHRLKGAVEDWARNLEADIGRGEFIDPTHSKTTVAQVWETYAGSRRLEAASRKRDESHWRCWVEPKWGKVPVGSILKPDVQKWVNKLEEDKVGGWTIIAAANVLKAVLELAVDAGLTRANPARRVKLPMPPKHEDRVITAGEEKLILGRLDELFGGRRDARLFVEGLFDTGCRWEEWAAVSREAVDLRNGLVAIGPVMERSGEIRSYPKGARSRASKGFHDVPLTPGYLSLLRPVVLATEPGGLVFTAPKGGPILYPTWRSRVWRRAVDGLAEPVPTPHDVRHTFGTRLADAGVELHDRMALMGHADVRSGMRYTHSGQSRYDRAREALKRARS